MHLLRFGLIRIILIAVLGPALISCAKTSQEEATAKALQEQLKYLDSDHLADHKSWFNWQLAVAAKHNGYYDNVDRKYLLKYKQEFDQISLLYFMADSLQQAISNRYQNKLNATLTLKKTDLTRLQKLESIIKELVQDEEAPELLRLKSEVTAWVGKKSWIDTYLEHQPAYAAILHLEVLKTMLTNAANYLHQINAIAKSDDGPCGWWDGFIPNYHLFNQNTTYFKDTLNAGKTGRAMIFLSSYYRPFFCPPIAYPCPKAFRINGKDFPISIDTLTYDVIAKIAIPASKKSQKASEVKSWSGAWVIALSPEKDSLIQTGGTYLIK